MFACSDVTRAVGYLTLKERTSARLKFRGPTFRIQTMRGSRSVAFLTKEMVDKLLVHGQETRAKTAFGEWLVKEALPTLSVLEAQVELSTDTPESKVTERKRPFSDSITRVFTKGDWSVRVFKNSTGVLTMAGTDVCSALGFKEPGRAISKHCPDEPTTYAKVSQEGSGRFTVLRSLSVKAACELADGATEKDGPKFKEWLICEVVPAMTEEVTKERYKPRSTEEVLAAFNQQIKVGGRASRASLSNKVVLTSELPRSIEVGRAPSLSPEMIDIFSKMTINGGGLQAPFRSAGTVASYLRRYLDMNHLPGKPLVQYWEAHAMVFWISL
jgi:prophage antirepressor-like protein